MFGEYFTDFHKNLAEKKKPAKKTEGKAATKKTSAKKASGKAAAIDIKKIQDKISRIIPSRLSIDAVRAIDDTGFSPDGIDLVIYDEYCPDIIKIMGGYVPSDLIYGTIHLVQKLTAKTLQDVLNNVTAAKKLNTFSEYYDRENEPVRPAFIIAAQTDYSFQELKNDVLNYYMSKSIDSLYEFDILTVLNNGLVIKDWREKRNFIALETKEDTGLWFFILMNEYLEVERKASIDFRKYVKKDVVYREF